MAVSLPVAHEAWPLTGPQFSRDSCIDDVTVPVPTQPRMRWQDLTSPLQLCLTTLTSSSNELDGKSCATVEAITSVVRKPPNANSSLLVSAQQCCQWTRVQQNEIAVSTADQDNRRAELFASGLKSSVARNCHDHGTRQMPVGTHTGQLLKAANIPPLVGPLTGLVGRTGYTTPSALLNSAKSLTGSFKKIGQLKKQAPIQVLESPPPSPESQQNSNELMASASSLKRRHIPDMPSLTTTPPTKKLKEVTTLLPVPRELHHHKQPFQQDSQTQTEQCTAECLCHEVQQLVPLDTRQLVEQFNKHLNVLAQKMNMSKSNPPRAAQLSPKEVVHPKEGMPGAGPDLKDSVWCECGQPTSSRAHSPTPNQGHGQSTRRDRRSLTADQVDHFSSEKSSSSVSTRDTLSTLRPCVRCSRPAVFVCSKCRLVWYCSTTCQAESWLTHCAKCSNVVNLTVAKDEPE